MTQKMSLDELAMILAQNGYTVVPPAIPARPETVEEEGVRLYREGRAFSDLFRFVSDHKHLNEISSAYLRERDRQEIKTVVITFKGGWGGGGFLYNGMYSSDFKKKHGINPAPINGQVLTITMMDPSGSFQAEVIKEIKREGTDFDHGHTYDWESNDFLLKDPNLPNSPLVANEVSLMYLLNGDYEVSYDL